MTVTKEDCEERHKTLRDITNRNTNMLEKIADKVNQIFTTVEVQKNKMDSVESVLNDNSDEHKVIMSAMADWKEHADERYADKKTEKNVDRLMWIVITAVVVGLLTLIIK